MQSRGSTPPPAPKVLVVDDDKDMVALLTGLLKAAGYRTVSAFDAMQGGMVAARELPALIILDLQMPAGGGVQLLERLTTSLRTQAIPVLAITANTQKGMEEYMRRRGATDFLAKPFEPEARRAAGRTALGT